MEPLLIAAGAVFLFGFLLGAMIPSPLSWGESRRLREHLHTKMEIDAEGYRQVKKRIEKLQRVNENLRTTIATLKGKPGRQELRQLHIYERGLAMMQARAPGFGPYWHNILREVEQDMALIDQGAKSLIRRVFRPIVKLPSAAKLLDVRLGKKDPENK